MYSVPIVFLYGLEPFRYGWPLAASFLRLWRCIAACRRYAAVSVLGLGAVEDFVYLGLVYVVGGCRSSGRRTTDVWRSLVVLRHGGLCVVENRWSWWWFDDESSNFGRNRRFPSAKVPVYTLTKTTNHFEANSMGAMTRE